MVLPLVHGEFRAAADPDLRFAPSGVAVGRVRAVASSRKRDPNSGDWTDDKTLWVNVVCFNALAENMVESIEKGALFLVEGRLQTDEWQDKDGHNRTTVEIVADRIGPSLAYATAKVAKTERRAGVSDNSMRTKSETPADRGEQAGQEAWAGAGQSDDPPF